MAYLLDAVDLLLNYIGIDEEVMESLKFPILNLGSTISQL